MGRKRKDRIATEQKTSDNEWVLLMKSSTSDSLSSLNSFLLFLLPHVLAAGTSPIQDCDEVFNYWEAAHFLNHSYGFQTWEYSPIYAIRSWAYAGLHAGIVVPFKYFAAFLGGKTAEFYFARFILGVVCAICETRLFQVLTRTTSPRIALCFMLIMVTSSGMYHAATAFLPSSFAMYTAMLGAADFIDWRVGKKTRTGVYWFALGAILGWPFAGALVLPFITMEAASSIINGAVAQFVQECLLGGLRSSFVLTWQIIVDSYFYGKLVCVPWNIVAYNIFGGSSKGPDIYGTEPWHFYLRNLVLNFNIWFLLALLAVPILFLQHFVLQRRSSNQPFGRMLTFLSPLYLWLAIFTIQPHKEERFMYPAYPFLALNAAVSLHNILHILGHTTKSTGVKIPPVIKLAGILVLLFSATILSHLRTIGLVTGYSAPLKIYNPLQKIARPGDFVCLGKEWYRFPSSYFLPDGVKAKFIKSAFTGLLPGEFRAFDEGLGGIPGTRSIPSGMNDENQEDLSKYTEISRCDFLVDSHFPESEESALEPSYVNDLKNWERVACEPFLNAASTSVLGRLLWIPNWRRLPRQLKRQWAEYCLLRRKT